MKSNWSVRRVKQERADISQKSSFWNRFTRITAQSGREVSGSVFFVIHVTPRTG